MNTSAAPPQETKKATKIRYIPREIIEEILSNLRVKPLLRFSAVSKSWNAMIFGSKFVKKHRDRAAALGGERIIIKHNLYSRLPSSFPLSAVTDNPTVDPAAALVFPFRQSTSIAAFCDELWLLKDSINEIVWNPSMRKYYVLPKSNFCHGLDFLGLGYDAVHDDYKVLRVGLDCNYKPRGAELYSRRRNSWREIQPPFGGDDTLRCGTWGVVVGGALNWLFGDDRLRGIVTFDLSTEEYGELALPEMDKGLDGTDITVLRGKLCLFIENRVDRFVFWMMEDYGVAESWTRVFDIETFPRYSTVRPFYFFDDGRFLISIFVDRKLVLGYLVPGGEKEDYNWVFLSKAEETRVSNYFNCGTDPISDIFVYSESLVSPGPARAPV